MTALSISACEKKTVVEQTNTDEIVLPKVDRTENEEKIISKSDQIKASVTKALSDTNVLSEGLVIGKESKKLLNDEFSQTAEFIKNDESLKYEMDPSEDNFYFEKSTNTVFYPIRTDLNDPLHVAALVHETWHAKRNKFDSDHSNENPKSIRIRESVTSLYEECLANYLTVLVADNQMDGTLKSVSKSFMFARENATTEEELMTAVRSTEEILRDKSKDSEFMKVMLSYSMYVFSDTNEDVVNRGFCDAVKGYYQGNNISLFEFSPKPESNVGEILFPNPLIPYHSDGAFVYEGGGRIKYVIF